MGKVEKQYLTAADLARSTEGRALCRSPAHQSLLGLIYERGWGVERDPSLAIFWHTSAAANGVSDSKYALGIIYRDGQGVKPDPDLAAGWCEMAARDGHMEAKRELESLLRFHKGLCSISYLTLDQRADIGDVDAQFEKGMRLCVTREPDHSHLWMMWMHRAAKQGHPIAQEIISCMDIILEHYDDFSSSRKVIGKPSSVDQYYRAVYLITVKKDDEALELLKAISCDIPAAEKAAGALERLVKAEQKARDERKEFLDE